MEPPGSKVLHRLGLIADIQYADIPNTWNFEKTNQRLYRNTVVVVGRAIDWWSKIGQLDFAVNLGDIIDGTNRGKDGMGKSALNTVLKQMYKGQVFSFVAFGDISLSI
jgi:hypothetical protein